MQLLLILSKIVMLFFSRLAMKIMFALQKRSKKKYILHCLIYFAVQVGSPANRMMLGQTIGAAHIKSNLVDDLLSELIDEGKVVGALGHNTGQSFFLPAEEPKKPPN